MKYFGKCVAIILLVVIVISCRKKGCTDPLASNYDEKANYNDGTCEYDTINENIISIKTYHLFNSYPFYLDSIYYDDFGNKIKFSRAIFYLGNPSFKDINGTINKTTSDYTLINPNNNLFSFTSLETLDISSINLRIGVDSISNHIDPAIYSSTNPLSYQSPSMHWMMGTNPQNWSYLFIVIEGQVDKDGNNNFDSGENFVFHIGGDGFSRLIQDVSINILDSSYFSIDIHWESIINNIDLSINNFTHTTDNISLATEVSNNSTTLISEHL